MTGNHIGGQKPNTALRDKAVELSRLGLGIKSIAAKIGCSTQLVRKARRAAGMPTWIGPRGGKYPEERAIAAMRIAFEDETSLVRTSDESWFGHGRFLEWANRPHYWRNVEKNRERSRIAAIKKYHKRKHDGVFRFERSARFRIWKACKDSGSYKSANTESLVGCSIALLRSHIESQFKRGMSWANYGKWHVDHIIPCSSFDLSNPEQQRQCFHYSNLQPLWARENLSKHHKMPANPQLALLI